MTQSKDGGNISIALEYERYDFDEAITLSTTYAVSLKIDAMKIRESTIQFTNKGTVAVTYKIFGSAKKAVKIDSATPETEDEWINILSSGTYDHTTEKSIPASVKATGTVTCVSAVATDTVTVNGLVYTAVAGVKTDNTEFSIDTGDNETATDLADSITNDTRTGTDVATIDQTATSSTNVVTITASETGAEANSIGLSSNSARLAVSAATLTGGVGTRAFETFSNPWRWVIVMAKAASGTPTLKIWHRGEN